MGVLKRETRAARNIRWVEEFCRVPEGKDVGRRLRLRVWQKRILREIYDEQTPARTMIVSFGRKNGKTTLAAALLCLHLAGPESVQNSQLYSTAMAEDQAALLFDLAAKMIGLSPRLNAHITRRYGEKELYCPRRGTLYRALSAEPRSNMGRSTSFAVHDELGQVAGPRSRLYDAVETSFGAHRNPLSVIISTQAATNNDLLSILIDDAMSGADPRIKCILYTAPVKSRPFSKAAIKAANPAYGDFLNPGEVDRLAANARRMPSQEASFRNLILNQRVSQEQLYVSPATWAANGGPPAEDWGRNPVYMGLDLSESRDLTALVMVMREGDVYHIRPRFWLPSAGLREKAEKDRVPYDLWHRQGFLMTSPGASVEYDFVAEHLRGLFDRLNVVKVAFDRYNWKHFRPSLTRAGFSDKEIESKFEEFGQGYSSMSPALRDLDGVLANERGRHGMHPVLEMCTRNAVEQRDPRGNRKLAKMTDHARIDGMIALVMAVAVLNRDWNETPEPSFVSRHGVVML